jgi:hypothetical protein
LFVVYFIGSYKTDFYIALWCFAMVIVINLS